MQEKFFLEPNLNLLVFENLAYLGAMSLRQLEVAGILEFHSELRFNYGILRSSVGESGIETPELLLYSMLFNDTNFSNLLAVYYEGDLNSSGYSQQDLQDFSSFYGLEIPQSPGPNASFYVLIMRSFQICRIRDIEKTAVIQMAAALFLDTLNSGISSFGEEMKRLNILK